MQEQQNNGMGKFLKLVAWGVVIVAAVNVDQPNYSKVADYRLVPEEFEKTPKRSIKRYMYQK